MKTTVASIRFIKHLIDRFSKQHRGFNKYVKKYYRINKHKKITYKKNYWCNDPYWDFFYHSLPHTQPSKKFIPAAYYAGPVESAFNNSRFSDFVNEKNYYDLIFANSDVKLPKTYFRLIDGVLLDDQYGIMGERSVVEKCIDREIILKSSLGGGGTEVYKAQMVSGNFQIGNKMLGFNDLRRLMGGNAIAQEIVTQNEFMSQFHPGSLNTLRLFSFRHPETDEVLIIMGMLRMGMHGSFVDNASVGGIAAGVDFETGKLLRYGLNQYGEHFEKHPDTGVKFMNKEIPQFDHILNTVKYLANIISHSKLVGWDIALSANDEIVLIEANVGTGVWMLQLANGKPLFGNMSDYVRAYVHAQRRKYFRGE